MDEEDMKPVRGRPPAAPSGPDRYDACFMILSRRCRII
jgi:hypothetical protein